MSGEYFLIKNAIQKKILKEDSIIDSLFAFKRAGACAIVTYFAVDIAKKLKLKFENHEDFCDVSIANPGFLNFTLQEDVWQKLLFNLLETGEWKYEQFGKNNNLNLEFVSANPTGPLHAGHARGAVVGDCLARILKLVGFNVTREYYINDAGNQIDVLNKSVQLRYLEQLSGINANIPENFYPGTY